MHITQAHYIAYIRLMGLGCQWIPQKDHQIDLVVFDLCTDLLFSSQMSSKIFVYIQVGDLFDQPYNSFLLKIPRYAMQKFCISFFLASCAISAMFI